MGREESLDRVSYGFIQPPSSYHRTQSDGEDGEVSRIHTSCCVLVFLHFITITQLVTYSYFYCTLIYRIKKAGDLRGHHDLEFISALLNLEYAIKADAW
jgi:hypothetical protein